MSRNSTLNVFGDSYSTPNFCVDSEDSYWGLAAKDLAVTEIVNYSYPGFSLDHMIHILLNENFDFKHDYFLIGIPPLIRYLAYSDDAKSEWPATIFNNEFISNYVPVHSLDNTLPFQFEEQFRNDRTGVDRFSREWIDVQSLEKIFLLHQYLTQNNAKFLILNLTVPIVYQDMWPVGQSIMRKVGTLKECVLFDDTYQSVNHRDNIRPEDFDQYGWLGHHGVVGNLNWYTKIIKNKMIELNWINNA